MNLNDTDLNQIRALHALLEEASVGRAAERLGITSPAASNALRRLRERFDDPLLVRVGRGMTRTPLAESLRGPTRTAVEAIGRVLLPETPFDPQTFDGHFVIGGTDYVATLLLPHIDQVLADAASRASLRLRAYPRDPADWLDRTGDVLIRPFYKPPQNLRLALLFRDPFVCVMSRTHPLADGPLTAEAYATAEHLLVAPVGESDRGVVDPAIEALGLSRRVVRSVFTFSIAAELLAGGRYIATLPRRFVQTFRRFDDYVVHAPPVPLPASELCMIWHARHTADARHRWLRQAIQTAAARTRAR